MVKAAFQHVLSLSARKAKERTTLLETDEHSCHEIGPRLLRRVGNSRSDCPPQGRTLVDKAAPLSTLLAGRRSAAIGDRGALSSPRRSQGTPLAEDQDAFNHIREYIERLKYGCASPFLAGSEDEVEYDCDLLRDIRYVSIHLRLLFS